MDCPRKSWSNYWIWGSFRKVGEIIRFFDYVLKYIAWAQPKTLGNPVGNPAGHQSEKKTRQATMVESRHFNNIIHAHTEAGHDLSGFFLFQRDVKTYQKKRREATRKAIIGFVIGERWSQKVIQLAWLKIWMPKIKIEIAQMMVWKHEFSGYKFGAIPLIYPSRP